MAPKSAPKRRPPARLARPKYHEPQPGGTSRGNTSYEKAIVGEKLGLGAPAWAIIVIIALLLVDTFVWNGYYAHQLWRSLDAGGTSARNWSDNLWN